MSKLRHTMSHLKRPIDFTFGRGLARWLLTLVALTIAQTHPLSAEEVPAAEVLKEGRTEFEWYCTACHGPDGKGDGPQAKTLAKKPAGLTAIAKNNNGTFPFWRVYRIVSGKEEVPGHESFDMPEFWRHFKREEKDWDEPMPPYVRVLILTHYVKSIQKD